MFHRSERLFLRPVWEEDAPAIYRGIADEVIVRNLARAPWPYGMEDARSFAKLPRNPAQPDFAITLPDTGEYVGQCGYGPDEDGQLQVGYWIAREHWGKGFATEATRALLDIGRALGFGRIVAAHFVDNPASGKVLRKAGFRATGEVRPLYSRARDARHPAARYVIDLSDEETSPGGMLRAA
ncbi:GNAT family N-acetyltransferase [Parerythrobacter aestuarii]|uniref:GNAT family N-acetyltransferase n=1 Tax=Parerythrobacter aestuarii TaxID=3020909 RepID=UPI0024DE2106|nr:GNAT family N-acetyltransferase [Parerythrobacter aestuarii]